MTQPVHGIRIKKSSAGLGLFATRPFAKGEHIIEYTGERISHNEADRRGGKYLFIMNDEFVIDGRGREHTGRYVNHACKPNAEAIFDEERMRVDIVAKRKILPGNEVTYNYGKVYWKEYIQPNGCRCTTCAVK